MSKIVTSDVNMNKYYEYRSLLGRKLYCQSHYLIDDPTFALCDLHNEFDFVDKVEVNINSGSIKIYLSEGITNFEGSKDKSDLDFRVIDIMQTFIKSNISELNIPESEIDDFNNFLTSPMLYDVYLVGNVYSFSF